MSADVGIHLFTGLARRTPQCLNVSVKMCAPPQILAAIFPICSPLNEPWHLTEDPQKEQA
jgi:hypothetical protein